jgi:hypothetical protein
MATVASRGSTVVSSSGSTWTGATSGNLCDGAVGSNPNTNATFTTAVNAAVGTVVIGGYFGAGSIDTMSTISAISAVVRNSVGSPTSRWTSVTAQLQDSTGTNIGAAQTVALNSGATSVTITPNVLPTVAQVQAGLRMSISATKSGTSSATFSLDYVDITVTYAAVVPTGASLAITMGTPIVTGWNTNVAPTGASLAITGGTPIVTYAPKISTLVDPFDTQDNSQWVYGNSHINVTHGVVEHTPGAGTAAVLQSKRTYDLTASAIYFRIPRYAPKGTNAVIALNLVSFADPTFNTYEQIVISRAPTVVYPTFFMGETIAGSSTFNFNGGEFFQWWDQWLRIRESGGTIFWDSSADGINWGNFTSHAKGAIDITNLYVQLYAYSDDSSALIVDFDSVNVPQASIVKASNGKSNFTPDEIYDNLLLSDWDGSPAAFGYWCNWNENPGATISGNAVTLTPPNLTSSEIDLNLSRSYDLTSSAVYCKASGISVATLHHNTVLFVQDVLASNSQAFIGVGFDGVNTTTPQLIVSLQINSAPPAGWAPPANPAYNSTTHAWWRIRESGATIFWDYSSNGINWTNHYSFSISGLWVPTSVEVNVEVYHPTVEASAPSATFSNLNVPPTTPNPAQLVLTMGTPLVKTPILCVPTGASLSITMGTPLVTIQNNILVQPTGASLSVTMDTPLVINGTVVKPTGASLSVTMGTPLVINGTIVKPSGASLSITMGTPLVVLGNIVSPAGANLAITGGTPIVLTPIVSSPASATISVTMGIPIVLTPTTVTPDSASLTITMGTPVVQVTSGNNIEVIPGSASLTITPDVPIVTINTISSPDPAALTITMGTPIVTVDTTVSPDSAVLTLTPGTPVIKYVIRPIGASLTITPGTPLVTAPYTVKPTGPTLTLTMGRPIVRVTAPSGNIITHGGQLVVYNGHILILPA